MSNEDMVKFMNRGFFVVRYNNNVYVNFFQLVIMILKYVDSGVFENIWEQFSVEENSYNWNIVLVCVYL